MPDCMAPAQPDAELARPSSSARDQVSGYDRVIGTHRIKRRPILGSLINEYERAA